MVSESFVFELGDTVDCCKLNRMIARIHYCKQDIWDGDVADRIEKFSYYQLKEIAIESIVDYKDYSTDFERVDAYSDLDYQTMPPIIVHRIEGANDFWLVDGGHRAQSCLKQGRQTIKAFVNLPNNE